MMKVYIYVVLFSISILLTGCYTVPIEIQSDDPKVQLKENYSIYLDSKWSETQTQRLFSLFEAISPEPDKIPSAWKISNEDLENDIQMMTRNSLNYVTINRDVFRIDDSQQELVSNRRFFYAVVEYITKNGSDREALKQILQKRYGISVDIPSYTLLLQHTTQETDKDYTDFENEDLMVIISILEEFPHVLQNDPHLRYLLCRIDDEVRAPGVAWTSNGYIELSQKLFKRDFVDDTRRLIAHEKAHFLWAHLFPQQLKQDWMELGGWYRDAEREEGWATTKDRKAFITDYAYEKNPNEDMAESLAYYLVFPEKLRTCSEAKFLFIQERIMQTYGEDYVSLDSM